MTTYSEETREIVQQKFKAWISSIWPLWRDEGSRRYLDLKKAYESGWQACEQSGDRVS